MKRIINVDEVVLERHEHGDKFAAGDGAVGTMIGSRLLGASLIVVPPGKRAYPFHCHHVNEEMFVVLDGVGAIRIGEDTFPLEAGDIIAAPLGGRAEAHQIINTSEHELRYLAVSTMIQNDVIEYPDADKVAVYVGSAPGEEPGPRTFNFRGHLGARADYWDGE